MDHAAAFLAAIAAFNISAAVFEMLCRRLAPPYTTPHPACGGPAENLILGGLALILAGVVSI